MKTLIYQDMEKIFSNMTVEELLNIEEKILKILKKKIKNEKNTNLKKDFLEISVWDHLNDNSIVRVDKWQIETF